MAVFIHFYLSGTPLVAYGNLLLSLRTLVKHKIRTDTPNALNLRHTRPVNSHSLTYSQLARLLHYVCWIMPWYSTACQPIFIIFGQNAVHLNKFAKSYVLPVCLLCFPTLPHRNNVFSYLFQCFGKGDRKQWWTSSDFIVKDMPWK